MNNNYPPTVNFVKKKPDVPKPPEPIKDNIANHEGVSVKGVALWFSGVLMGIIFGLLIGRFV